MKKILSLLSVVAIGATASSTVVACSTSEAYAPGYNSSAQYPKISPIDKRNFDPNADVNKILPQNTFIPRETENGKNPGDLNTFASDPISIVYNDADKLYYGWQIFNNNRNWDDNSWVEVTSPDLIHWTQASNGSERIRRGDQFENDTSTKTNPAKTVANTWGGLFELIKQTLMDSEQTLFFM